VNTGILWKDTVESNSTVGILLLEQYRFKNNLCFVS